MVDRSYKINTQFISSKKNLKLLSTTRTLTSEKETCKKGTKGKRHDVLSPFCEISMSNTHLKLLALTVANRNDHDPTSANIHHKQNKISRTTPVCFVLASGKFHHAEKLFAGQRHLLLQPHQTLLEKMAQKTLGATKHCCLQGH